MKTKRAAKTKKKLDEHHQLHLTLADVQPKTENQARAFDAWDEEKNLVMMGSPGTGKSFLSFYLAADDALVSHRRIYIVRSAVPSRDLGFLPGSLAEKTEVYEAPYRTIASELYGRGDAYELLTKKEYVRFVTTSFLRGITLDNCIIIVDEFQNMTAHELNTVISRLGENSKIIFTGDIKQSDLQKQWDRSGLPDFVKILRAMDEFKVIEFGPEDILRSDLVKSYIIARERLEAEGEIKPL